jgi:hypothetical protein
MTGSTNGTEWRPTIEDLVPGLRPQAGDEVALVESLKDDLMRELNPSTAYERLMAGQLVSLELEVIRLRQMMDSILLSAFLERMERVAQHRIQRLYDAQAEAARPGSGDVFDDFDADMAGVDQMRQDIARAGPARAAAIESLLAAGGQDAIRLQAEIRLAHADSIEPFELRLIAAEERRRRLRADYTRLLAARPRAPEDVEDAELDAALQDIV